LALKLKEKKVQLLRQMLENKWIAHKYHAKMIAEMGKGADNIQYLQSKQEAELKVSV
jgi:hypothetical protein